MHMRLQQLNYDFAGKAQAHKISSSLLSDQINGRCVTLYSAIASVGDGPAALVGKRCWLDGQVTEGAIMLGTYG